MRLYDQHLHSCHSFDSRTPPEDNVRAAIDRNLAGLTFTEHFDPNPREWPTCIYDHGAYTDAILPLRKRYGHHIEIGQGIEVGYHEPAMDFVLSFLSTRRFDLVVLSLHSMGEDLLNDRAAWAPLDPAEAARRYFDHLLEAVEFVRDLHHARGHAVFHVLGHLDLVKRYAVRYLGKHDTDGCGERIDGILRTCLEADLIPEVNTSSLRQGLDEPMPGPDILRRYVACGGTTVTLGSDAHRSRDIGAGFAEVLPMLRQPGITHQAVFRQGRRTLIPLSEAD